MSKLEAFRKRRDTFFLKHPRSPLSVEQKKDFQGMDYFPENPSLELVVEIERFEEKEEIQIETTTGDTQTFARIGRFKFDVEGQETELILYAGEKGYFLPFTDALAGKETYKIGRYVEVKPMTEDRFRIDFNMAYNPFCAYSEGHSCLIPPDENHIDVPIRAGEKVFDH